MSRSARHRIAAAAAVLALVAGCRRPSDAEAREVVRTYVARVADAYRASDAELAAPAASDREAMKLTALIGVKRDAGVNLDARLVELAFGGVERKGGEVVVETRERWSYRDLRIGSGAQVGEASDDAYHLRYRLARERERWVVDRVEFVEPPQVGRRAAPLPVDPRALHGLPPREAGR